LSRALTAHQDRFVDEYLIDLNGTQAAIRAGASPRSASVTASRWLANANVRAAIDARRKELADSAQVTQERIVREYARLAFADMRDAASWNDAGLSLVASDDLDPMTAAAVKAVKVVRTITRGKDDFEQERIEQRIEMHDKKGALDSLGRTLGMFVEQVDVNVRSQALLAVANMTEEQLLRLAALDDEE
jgi:phage terminase small subunit